jgi:hypothetical protein
MVMCPVALGPENTAPVRTSSNCKRQTRPPVRKGVPHQQTRNCLTLMKMWFGAQDGGLTPRQTGRLTVGCNISLTLTLISSQSSRVRVESQSRENLQADTQLKVAEAGT